MGRNGTEGREVVGEGGQGKGRMGRREVVKVRERKRESGYRKSVWRNMIVFQLCLCN